LIIAIIWLSLYFDLRIRKLLHFILLEFSTYDYCGLVGGLHADCATISFGKKTHERIKSLKKRITTNG
jgi:hypothetical protein